MRILKRQFACVVAVGMLGGISSALAQGAPPPSNQPAPSNAPPPTAEPAEEMCDPPAACAEQPAQPQAQAEPQPVEPAPAPMPTTYSEPAPQHYNETVHVSMAQRIGLGFAVGGGLDDFAGSTMRDTTSLGGGWNARITVGTRQYIAIEGSYIGSAQSIDALGLDGDAVLVGNGAQAALRINILKDFYAQPFLYGGAAWRHYQITNNSINTSDVADHDDVFEVPAGIGFSGYIAGFMADVRGEYRWAFDEDLVPSRTTLGNEASLDRWGVSANLGFSY